MDQLQIPWLVINRIVLASTGQLTLIVKGTIKITNPPTQVFIPVQEPKVWLVEQIFFVAVFL